MNKAKVLILDIETSPILAYIWSPGEQFVTLDQIKEDWRIISVAFIWEDSDEVFQYDLRDGMTDANEKKLLTFTWKALNEADIVVGQNSKKFDVKKINEKFLQYGMSEPSPYRQIDTYVESKKYFAPTSHKLEYRSKQLNKKYKKLKHSKFPGLSLWIACLNGIKDAWNEMGIYNIYDVRSTKEYFNILKPWIKTVNFSLFGLLDKMSCPRCGHTKLQNRGTITSNTGIFKRYQCQKCGKWSQAKANLLTPSQKKNILK